MRTARALHARLPPEEPADQPLPNASKLGYPNYLSSSAENNLKYSNLCAPWGRRLLGSGRQLTPQLTVGRRPPWGGMGGGVWLKASVSDCLPLAAPIGLSPLLILTHCGPERVLVVSTEPLDDLSCLPTPGSAVPETGCCPCC